MSLKTIKLFFVLLLCKITVADFITDYLDERINEDCFWADGLSDTSLGLHKPELLEAARFCIEKSRLSLQFDWQRITLCLSRLRKYEYDSFWKQFIS